MYKILLKLNHAININKFQTFTTVYTFSEHSIIKAEI